MKTFKELTETKKQVGISGIEEFRKRIDKYLDRIINDIKPSDTPDRIMKRFSALAKNASFEWKDIARDEKANKK